MPIYEFKCDKCNHLFDFLARNISDTPEKCPKCGASKMSKQLSTFAAVATSNSGAACSMGSCATPTCSTGACPFG